MNKIKNAAYILYHHFVQNQEFAHLIMSIRCNKAKREHIDISFCYKPNNVYLISRNVMCTCVPAYNRSETFTYIQQIRKITFSKTILSKTLLIK